MYLVDSNHVALLARNGCVFGTDESQVILVAISNGLPMAAAIRFPTDFPSASVYRRVSHVSRPDESSSETSQKVDALMRPRRTALMWRGPLVGGVHGPGAVRRRRPPADRQPIAGVRARARGGRRAR